MSLRAFLIWFIEDCSASFSVLALNELKFSPVFTMLKDRSRMHRKRQILWAIMATGDNLSLDGILSFRPPTVQFLQTLCCIYPLFLLQGIGGIWGVDLMGVHRSRLQLPIGRGSSWFHNPQGIPLRRRHQRGVQQD